MSETPIFTLHLENRAAIQLAGATVASAGEAAGLDATERLRLHALTGELLDTIVADAFDGHDEVDIDVTLERRPGEIAVVVNDRGAPTQYANGAAPPRVSELVRLGFADGLEFTSRGREGNSSVILKNLHYASVREDSSFTAETAADTAGEIQLDDEGQAVLDIRPMTPEDVVEVARLFYRVYSYSAYYASVVYEPERLAEYVRAGRHFATIAVTPGGRVVGHLATKVESPGDVTGTLGLLAVEPDLRRHHVALRVGAMHLTRLIDNGFVGQFTEAVTVHEGSQRIAATTGGHECGLRLAAQAGTLDFRGFDVDPGRRHAVVVFYGGIAGTPERTVHVPRAYEAIVNRIYTETKLPRSVVSDYGRTIEEAAEDTTRFRLDLGHESGMASLHVERYGREFVHALQSRVADLRLNRFDVINLYLPLRDPLTAYFGSGLQEMGFFFSAIFPEQSDGDELLLQMLNNVEVVVEDIKVVTDFGAELREIVLADWREVEDKAARRLRSRAHMARIYEAMA